MPGSSLLSKPKVFIGSSSEGLWAAKALLACLEDEDLDVVLWKDVGFELSTTPIESLERILNEYAVGVFVFTKDDRVSFREEDLVAPRDNVVFEVGLWLGRWGRGSCAIVSEEGSDLKLPSDLSAVTLGQFARPEEHRRQSEKAALRSTADNVADFCTAAARESRLQIPARWLWKQLIDPEPPIVIAVASPTLLRPRIVGDGPAVAAVGDMQYVESRQYTGMGETEAVGRIYNILSSLDNRELPLIYAAADVPQQCLANPLILLGGYYSNQLSEDLLTGNDLPVKMTKGGIHVGDRHYEPSVRGRRVTDYTCVMWCPNPYNPEQRVLLSAGYHSSGTVAGIHYLTHSAGKLPDLPDGKANFTKVLRVDSVSGRRQFPELVEFEPW